MKHSLLFPSQLFEPGQVDQHFQGQWEAAEQNAFSCQKVNQELLDEGNFTGAVRWIRPSQEAIYRGWMLRCDQYEGFYKALASQDCVLLNSPEQYRHCHWLPESFEIIRSQTPFTIWQPLEGDSVCLEELIEKASVFENQPILVKDYVKSRKHEWLEACFIPQASDKDQLHKVLSTFIERQGEQLAGGLVLREFVELESVGTHPQSGMPLTQEYRVFVLDGLPLATGRYWPESEYSAAEIPWEEFLPTMKAVSSRFYTMDIALGKDGQWRIIELGDGQVAGLLGTIAPIDFFLALRNLWEK